jgi:hypothetical protein
MTPQNLGHRAAHRYNRLAKELAAFNYVLRRTTLKGPVEIQTFYALNGMIQLANRLFRRHPDIQWFMPIDVDGTMTQADLAIIVARLTAACSAFESKFSTYPNQIIDRHIRTIENAGEYKL